LRDAARRLDIGQWEVKVRGVRVDPRAVRRRLQGRGDRHATLLISPMAGTIRALITHRIRKMSLPPFWENESASFLEGPEQ
jgi:hypothetical protein